MTSLFKYLSIFILALSFFSCGKKTNDIKAGSICTIEDGEGKYGVVKVLVINEEEAHVKIYKNKYDKRPAQVDLKTLSLGSITDPDGFGIGHVPLERKGFDNWKPEEVAFEEVSKDELEGYELWKNQ
jgi:hypothetical protein